MPRKLIVADLFAGAGGSSTGCIQAAESLSLRTDLTAVNHWPVAVETHSANHPQARHLCETLDNVDPRKVIPGKKLDLLIASPECTHHSNARGGKPCDDQSRSTAWHVVRWADALQPRAILVENVREWQDWGPLGTNARPLKRRKGETFQAWCQALRSLGYTLGHAVLNAADYGDPTTRKRLFVIAVRGKRQLPWPVQTHAENGGKADLFGTLKPWRAAREVIDWALKGESIFSRKKALSDNTMARIREGLRRFGGQAFLTPGFGERQTQRRRVHDLAQPTPTVTGTGHLHLVEPFVLGQQSGSVARPAGQPVPTIATDGAIGLVQPFVMQMSQSGSNGRRMRPAGEPLVTVTTADDLGVVEPFLVNLRGTASDQIASAAQDIDAPVPTISAQGQHSALCEPFLVNMRGTGTADLASTARCLDRPLPTVAGQGHDAVCSPFLVKYNGTGTAYAVSEPVDTVTARDRFGLVEVDGMRLDVLFRMLQPHELALAQGFPAGYRFAGNRTERVKQIGNAVCVGMSRALCLAILEAIAA